MKVVSYSKTPDRFFTNLALCYLKKLSVYYTVIKFLIVLNLELKFRARRQVCLVVFSKFVYHEFKKRGCEYSQQTWEPRRQ
jgi:hypothetical protein